MEPVLLIVRRSLKLDYRARQGKSGLEELCGGYYILV
jgi:hypothetical protein